MNKYSIFLEYFFQIVRELLRVLNRWIDLDLQFLGLFLKFRVLLFDALIPTIQSRLKLTTREQTIGLIELIFAIASVL